MNHLAAFVLRRAARVPNKVATFVRASVEAQIAILTIAITVPLVNCGLPPSEVNAIVKGALTFACDSVVPFIPTKNPALASTICKGGAVGAGVLGDIIESAIDAPPPGVRVVQPQGEIAAEPVTCAGGVVATVPPGIAAKVQAEMSKRKECAE